MNFTVAKPQVSATVQDPASVDAAISSRFSARAYLNKPVDRAVLQEVLEIAARAPSGTNTQPWKVYVLQGAKRDELVAKTCAFGRTFNKARNISDHKRTLGTNTYHT